MVKALPWEPSFERIWIVHAYHLEVESDSMPRYHELHVALDFYASPGDAIIIPNLTREMADGLVLTLREYPRVIADCCHWCHPGRSTPNYPRWDLTTGGIPPGCIPVLLGPVET